MHYDPILDDTRPVVTTVGDFTKHIDEAEESGIRQVAEMLREDQTMAEVLAGADDPVACVRDWQHCRSVDPPRKVGLS